MDRNGEVRRGEERIGKDRKQGSDGRPGREKVLP